MNEKMPSLPPVPQRAIQRRCSCGSQAAGRTECAECTRKSGTLQRKTLHGQAVDDVPAAVHDVLQSSGHGLGARDRGMMESRFGRDFSAVRVHTDTAAAQSAGAIDAAAYTLGRDIVFGAGQYAPSTPNGQRLLAHELAHVVQQAGQATPSSGLRIGSAGDAHEQQADRAADAVMRPAAASAAGFAELSNASAGAVQRQPQPEHTIGPGLPSMPGQLGGLTIRLQLDSRMRPTGKASVTVAGPDATPVVGAAEIGLGRNVDGTYTAVTGKGTTIVSAADVQKILASSPKTVDPKRPKELRLPSYADLHRPGLGALYTVAEFKQHALYLPSTYGATGLYWHSLPDWFLQRLIDACKPAAPNKAGPEYNDAPLPSGDTRVA